MINSKKSGLGILYHYNGKVVYAGSFKNDEIYGDNIQVYSKDGKVKFKGNSTDGLKEGICKNNDKNENKNESFVSGNGYNNEYLKHDDGIIGYQDYDNQNQIFMDSDTDCLI